MVDSDDEFERHPREKFREEREYGMNVPPSMRREDFRRREDWPERRDGGWGSRDRGTMRREYPREYGRPPRERYSPPPRLRHELSPPMKRMRPPADPWEERRYPYEAHYGNYPQDLTQPPPRISPPSLPTPPHFSVRSERSESLSRMDDMGPTQPPMMSFKAFVEQCEDSISEEEVMKKYLEYKLEFKRQQINEFFISHKEEEWFKTKYHPEEFLKRKEVQIGHLKRRADLFFELEPTKWMKGITVDADMSHRLLKMMDAIVMKLEGGDDVDLAYLETETIEDSPGSSAYPMYDENNAFRPIVVEDKDVEISKPEDDIEVVAIQDSLQEKAKKFLRQKHVEKAENVEEKAKKRERGSNSESSSSSSSDSEDDNLAPPGMDTTEAVQPTNQAQNANKNDDDKHVKENGVPADSNGVKDTEDKKEEGEVERIVQKPHGRKPRPLHLMCSIFLRNLPPTITKDEVEAMCRRYTGYIRTALADPQPDRRWFRRGWVAFRRDVDINEICLNLNNIRLRDCEMGAIVNRDITRRVRTVNGITSHFKVVKADIKLCARIIRNLDARWELWNSCNQDGLPSLNMSAGNPVLRNITKYLIEEASAEEEELLGQSATADAEADKSNDDKEEGEILQRDELLIKVLDRLLLYLRVIHSVDFYNHSEYPNEDEMPHRCGIIHARGIPPTSKITPKEITDYCRNFENKIGSFLQPLNKLSVDDAKKFGLKDQQAEVENFVRANTQELGKDKWQCPLCQKKFKAEEFVHKHIMNKHAEKVTEVEKEVEYFNNYLRDPKRPQLPEYPGNKQSSRKEDFRDPYGALFPHQSPVFNYPNYYGSRYPAPATLAPFGGGSSYPKDFYRGPPEAAYRPRHTFRSRIGYRDLDAPKEDY